MRVMLIHSEACYFAGAQKVLGYFLEEIRSSNCQVVLALVDNPKLASIVPAEIEVISISSNQPFSVLGLSRQAAQIRDFHRRAPVDVIHGWTSRDWELASLVGALVSRPAFGTLHDHPRARFLSPKRRMLMYAASRWGLRSVICVSGAVRNECERVGYNPAKLAVVRNGLPQWKDDSAFRRQPNFENKIKLGFLGAFLERKGFQGLFDILAELDHNCELEWEIYIAGAAQDEPGKHLLAEIEARYNQARWWKRVHWVGWLDRPIEFLKTLDLLICPSSEFDPFPTVLLEAAKVGIPVFAADLGGVPEIVVEGKTGWMFEAGSWAAAGRKLSCLLNSGQVFRFDQETLRAVNERFSAADMVKGYLQLFKSVI